MAGCTVPFPCELGQIKPEEFPTASEIRAEPDEVTKVSDVESAILKLE